MIYTDKISRLRRIIINPLPHFRLALSLTDESSSAVKDKAESSVNATVIRTPAYDNGSVSYGGKANKGQLEQWRDKARL